MWLQVLGAVGSAATTVALLILVYTQAKPAVNRWATVKYLRSYCGLTFQDLITPELTRIPLFKGTMALPPVA